MSGNGGESYFNIGALRRKSNGNNGLLFEGVLTIFQLCNELLPSHRIPFSAVRFFRSVRTRLLSAAAVLTGAMCVLSASGCEDLLPEYRPPENIFQASYIGLSTLAATDTVEFSEPRDGSGGAVATYSPFYLTFQVKNTYEETFQYPVTPSGTTEIWMPGDRAAASSRPFSLTEMQPTTSFDGTVLTLDPGASVYFRVRVEPKLATGFYIHKYAAEHSFTIHGLQYYIARLYHPLNLQVRFTLQFSPDLPPVSVETTVPVKLKGRFPYSP